MIKATALGVLLVGLCGGCTTIVQISSSSEPAAQITAGKRIGAPVAITYNFDAGDLAKKAECAAFSFGFDAREAIQHTFDLENEQIFTNIVPAGAAADYVVQVTAEEIGGDMALQSGFWTSHVVAHANVELRVSIADRDRREIIRTAISGDGTGSADGTCPVGGAAIKGAVEKAVRRAGDEYAYRVLNSLQLPPKS